MNLFDLLVKDSVEHYITEYVENTPKDKIAAETLGLAVSQWAEWDGEKIALILITALYSGLEDANWHTESGVFYGWMKDLENGILLRELLKELE